MENQNTKTTKSHIVLKKKLLSWVLLVAMLLQVFSVTVLAFDSSLILGGTSSATGSVSGITHMTSDSLIAELKKQYIGTINQDLIAKIEDYQLKGEVGVIISFSEDSLIGAFEKVNSKGLTFAEYRTSRSAKRLQEKLAANQDAVLETLLDDGVISQVKYNYFNILDGAYVRTTYEQLEELIGYEGVERVIVSDTYLPAEATSNPVDVYDTGIFNSGSVEYTGKGTLVAVLDTGCDYTHSAFTTYTVKAPKYNRDDIAALLPGMMASTFQTNPLEAREVYYGNITGNKIAFGYDYADKDPDIMPFENSHGTHVAGIIGGYDDTITGVAIDTQFAIMKVFSDYKQGADDGDVLAALEDSIILGVDAINMSLGRSCGFTREVDNEYKNELYDRIEAAGISLIVAASNDHSSGFGAEDGNTNKTDNPDSATVGSPSTYSASLSVASINGKKDKYMYANGSQIVFFTEAYNMNSKQYDFFDMLGVNASNPIANFDYVTIPGYGYAVNYTGLDMSGKIALVSRGDITFEEKVQFAAEAGAAAIIIYNNVFGTINMTVGNDLKIPVISIGKDEGEILAAQETGVIEFNYKNEAGPFMSDFSSWGPNPDLTLKPEITAHGGNILSAVVGGRYEEMSGTSMATPNMCGIVVLIRQYVKEKYPNLTVSEVRDLVNQLCMSTATIALDKNGNPYSPRKQGAGIADIAKSTTTPAYLYVEGINKTKLELGDDPERLGVYEMTVQLKNLSDSPVSYRLGNIAMTESVSTSDPEYVAEMAYLLSGNTEYSVSGATLSGGVVTVAANSTATVNAKLVLSDADKAYINSNFKNGMYVEGFLTFENTDENGVDLNAPYLAFYGDWSEAPIFDLDYYEVETEAHNNAIDDDDKIKADYYATTPIGTYYYDYIIPLGAYVYAMDEEEYAPIPAVREHAAVSYYADAISGVYGVFSGLLRGAKELNISIVDTATGNVVWTETQYNCYKSHFSGAPVPYHARIDLAMANYETNEVFGANNAHYEVTMTAKLDWESENRNSLDTYSFSFYIDYEAPSVVDATFRTEYDKSREENRHYVDIMVYDNHYAMALRPIIIYDNLKDDDDKKTSSSLSEYPIPIYQENRGEATKVTVEITDYLDLIANSMNPNGLTVLIDDYALNSTICYIPFPDTDGEDLEFISDSMDLDINATFDLATYLVRQDTAENTEIQADLLRGLEWTTSDENVVAIHNGMIEARGAGSAIIKVTSKDWTEKVGGRDEQKYKSIVINVSENYADVDKPQIESLEFTSYETLFAFTSDIDFSEIGKTGDTKYFGGNHSVSFYPSEQIKLNYTLKPWNLSEDRYTLKWMSSNTKVATVDENGVVTAESEGNARITLQITIDGKTSLLAARCSITVKSEFIVENRTLVAYKGKGGDVVIPDDEGIIYIGAFAFCHYDLVNERYVEKDEDGSYDFDLKKDPLENTTVTSVVIPEGVEMVQKYAFYNCKELVSVELPETCKQIDKYAFANSPKLRNVNFDHISIIYDYAFQNCESFDCYDLGGVNLSGVYAIGDYAFSGTKLSDVKLLNLSRPGVGAFSNCTKLTDVELGEKTRISKKMFMDTPVKNIKIYSDIIEDEAFKNCSKLKSVEIVNDITYLGKSAFSGCIDLNSVTFGGVCEEISNLAFEGCGSLKSMDLPNCDLVMGEQVFKNSAIKSLTFQENTRLNNIGVGVFDAVINFTVVLNNSNYYEISPDQVIYSKDGKQLVLVLPGNTSTSFTVPATVETIFDGAFASNTKINTVKFASGSQIKTIGTAAFANCTALKTVTLPADRTVTIGDSAFYGTTSLDTVNLGNVSSVGKNAFKGSTITKIELTLDNVIIGDGAFHSTSKLQSATLGKGAVIGDEAFAKSNVSTVKFNGAGATVGVKAFAECQKLSNFDFANVSGALGDFAFYKCTKLTKVEAPYITSIGKSCFSDCTSLKEFRAAKLVSVGPYAFAHYNEAKPEEAGAGDVIAVFVAPELTTIGEYAFYGCLYLNTLNLSNVVTIGKAAFGFCEYLTTVTVTEKLHTVGELAFYYCGRLSNIDLSNVVRIEDAAFYGVKFPGTLNLNKVEYIGPYAFRAAEDQDHNFENNNLVTLNAPNVIEIGEGAFYHCSTLETVNAPKLEKIGICAFAQTGLKAFEITEALKEVEYSAFESNENQTEFYATVDGVKTTDYETENFKISDGVLYAIVPSGYVLMSYPTAKADTTYAVIDGTVRIDYSAFYANKLLERVELPSSLNYIGNFAFFDCDNLNTVVFKSYYAPVLEGTMNGETPDITPDTVKDFPGFDKLYKYDYYFYGEGKISVPLYYNNFGLVGSEKGTGHTAIVPLNSYGYDAMLYGAYFNVSKEENSGTVMGPAAIEFIEAVKKLPETADRFDKLVVENAINAYNALEIKPDEMKFVSEDLIAKFNKARSEYYVSVTEDKINHLFGMYNDEYSFELLKDARATYLALSNEERAQVKNAAVIDAKIAELTAAMGTTVDFSISYSAHFPEQGDDNGGDDNGNDDKKNGGAVVLIIILSVLGAAGVAAGVFFFLKKKNIIGGVKAETETETEAETEAEAETESANDADEGSAE